MRVKAWSIVTALALLLTSACSNAGGNNEPDGSSTAEPSGTPQESGAPAPAADPFGKYDQTVTYSIVAGTNPDPKYPEGETFENNKFLSFLEDKLNIKTEFMFTVPDADYRDKLNLAIASGELPDIFRVTDTTQFKRLIESDMIQPLDEAYAQYASPSVKQAHEAADNRALTDGTYNGKLYGIPHQDDMSNAVLVWVREDWRTKLNLPEPTNLADLSAVAEAFAKNDPDGNGKPDTIGISLQEDFLTVAGGMETLDPLFWSMDVYPAHWLKDKDGNVYYGGIDPKVKDALAKAAEMYKTGGIDPEFVVKNSGNTAEDLGAGKAGIAFQAWWAPMWPLTNTISNNPNAQWKAYALKNEAGVVNSGIGQVANSFLVVRKGFEHPELAMKIYNVVSAYKQWEYPELKDIENTLYSGANDKRPFPFGLYAEYIDKVVIDYDTLVGGMDGTIGEDQLDIGQKDLVSKLKSGKAVYEAGNVPGDKLEDWKQYTAWLSGAKAVKEANVNYVFSEYYGATDSMEKQWQTLNDKQIEAYMKIIVGKEPIESFDSFVEDWKKLGGDKITAEVNEAVKK
jgi:putative aldouronate transport system substrate-binding protein